MTRGHRKRHISRNKVSCGNAVIAARRPTVKWTNYSCVLQGVPKLSPIPCLRERKMYFTTSVASLEGRMWGPSWYPLNVNFRLFPRLPSRLPTMDIETGRYPIDWSRKRLLHHSNAQYSARLPPCSPHLSMVIPEHRMNYVNLRAKHSPHEGYHPDGHPYWRILTSCSHSIIRRQR